MQNQTDKILWRKDNAAREVPLSSRFDDPFFSLDDGVAETDHVFLRGNDLPARFAPGFHIAELGFGTGLNLLVAWDAWERSGQTGTLRFTSFEAFPMHPNDLRRAHACFPAFDGKSALLTETWSTDGGVWSLPGVELEIVIGDARQTVKQWQDAANAWFLDGFSPAKNPELWSIDLMRDVAQHTASNGTAATYTAAGNVRRALAQAGFEVSRVPGFGRKRHMTRAEMPK